MRWKEGLLFLIAGCMLTVVVSCGDEEGYAPSYEMGLLDLHTDATGKMVTAMDDLDREWPVVVDGKTFKADTVYRCMAVFVRQENKLEIHQLGSVLTMMPFKWQDELVFHADPVKVQSSWKVNRYINFSLQIPRKQLTHVLGCVDGGIRTMDGGYKKAIVYLYHDAFGDEEAFDATTYMSLPMTYYADSLVAGRDSIAVQISVKDKGWVSYPFPF